MNSEAAPPARGPGAHLSARTGVILATSGVAFAGYAATAARTITWWEGSSYPLAATELGIMSPPGSLVLTLLGWLASRVPVVQPVAFRLNLLAGGIAAATVAGVTWLTLRLVTTDDRAPRPLALVAGAAAGLALAFDVTVWTYAVQFAPYMLSAAITVLILLVALAWWDRSSDRDDRGRLFLLFLLFGLDFSVHRMNALLLPAALLWLTLRNPRGWARPARWLLVASGLVLGLGFQLLVIPLSLRHPALDMGSPRSLAGLWDYVSLKQYGGGFLVHLFPRRADVLRVQLGDYVSFLRHNLAPSGGGAVVRFLPALLVIAGWVAAARRAPARTLGLLGFFLCASLGAVFFFNVPEHYFRSLDRHYLPSLVILAPFLGVGAAALLRAAAHAPRPARPALVAGLGAALVLLPLGAWTANRRACDLHRTFFAEHYARDVLESLPRDALLLTNGDNDSFPLWYLQRVEHVREDVEVVNLPQLGMASARRQLAERHPELAALARLDDSNRLFTLPEAALRTPPDSVTVHVDGPVNVSEAAAFELLRAWSPRRPVCVACTVQPAWFPWLWPHLRQQGLSYVLASPSQEPAAARAGVRHALLEVVRYSDLAGSGPELDLTSQLMGRNYLAALHMLALAQRQAGETEASLATVRFADAHLSRSALGLSEDPFADLRAR